METEMSSYRRLLKKRLNRDNPHLLCFDCGKHTGKSCKHPLETDNLSFEVMNACSSESINPRWPALGRGSSFDFEQAPLQHPLKRRIERALFHLEQVVGNLLDVLNQRIAMHGLQLQGLEDHDLQCSGEEVAMFVFFRHHRNSMTRIAILEIGI